SLQSASERCAFSSERLSLGTARRSPDPQQDLETLQALAWTFALDLEYADQCALRVGEPVRELDSTGALIRRQLNGFLDRRDRTACVLDRRRSGLLLDPASMRSGLRLVYGFPLRARALPIPLLLVERRAAPDDRLLHPWTFPQRRCT